MCFFIFRQNMSTLSHELDQEENESLSFQDISRILSGRVKNASIVYSDLETIRGNYSLARILGSHDCACCLVTARRGRQVQRHWCTLLRIKGKIYWFDSLALPFSELDSLIGDNKLTSFLKKVKAVPNHRKLQAHLSKVKTCGCWTALRCAKYKLTNQQFVTWITSGNPRMDLDRKVAMLCYIGLQT